MIQNVPFTKFDILFVTVSEYFSSEYTLSLFIFFRAGYLSDSEAELDGEHNEVVLPQHVSSRGNIKSTKSAIRCVA